MPPNGLAILLGAGPTTGAGIARVLARPSQGNLAVALLSRSGDVQLAQRLSRESDGGVLKAFQTDTSEQSLNRAFDEVKQWSESLGKDVKLKVAIWSIKHSHRTPFEDESAQRFGDSLQTYVTGAMVFSQLCLKWMLAQYPADVEQRSGGAGEEEMVKKGTLIFTGTLGALRTNPGYAAYGAGRAGVRMLAQSLAREYSAKGVHVVHAIANGGILDIDASAAAAAESHETDADAKAKHAKVLLGERIRAESVGRLYLECMRQSCDLWVHELDMRPAREKF